MKTPIPPSIGIQGGGQQGGPLGGPGWPKNEMETNNNDIASSFLFILPQNYVFIYFKRDVYVKIRYL